MSIISHFPQGENDPQVIYSKRPIFFTLPASGWIESSKNVDYPYEQTVRIQGLHGGASITSIDINREAATAEQKDAYDNSWVENAETDDPDVIIFYSSAADGIKPAIDFPMKAVVTPTLQHKQVAIMDVEPGVERGHAVGIAGQGRVKAFPTNGQVCGVVLSLLGDGTGVVQLKGFATMPYTSSVKPGWVSLVANGSGGIQLAGEGVVGHEFLVMRTDPVWRTAIVLL